MLSVQYTEYGPPSVLKIVNVDKPILKDNEILIKNIATTVNSADVRLRKADPFLVRLAFGLFKPRIKVLGMVIAGVVESTGNNVTRFKVGDEVFGLNVKTLGGYAEYLTVPETTPLAIKPKNAAFEETASFVFGGHTALHFLKKAKITTGQKILIYGASGAVGSCAVQIAKYYGADVTAVCSGDNIEMVKSLGADRVIDYTNKEMSEIDEKFDIVYETVNKSDISIMAKLVKPNGTLILGAVIIKGLLQGLIISKRLNIKLIAGVAEVTSEDMNFIRGLVEENKLKPVIDRTYDLKDIVQAHKYVDIGHKKGDVVIKIK